MARAPAGRGHQASASRRVTTPVCPCARLVAPARRRSAATRGPCMIARCTGCRLSLAGGGGPHKQAPAPPTGIDARLPQRAPEGRQPASAAVSRSAGFIRSRPNLFTITTSSQDGRSGPRRADQASQRRDSGARVAPRKSAPQHRGCQGRLTGGPGPGAPRVAAPQHCCRARAAPSLGRSHPGSDQVRLAASRSAARRRGARLGPARRGPSAHSTQHCTAQQDAPRPLLGLRCAPGS